MLKYNYIIYKYKYMTELPDFYRDQANSIDNAETIREMQSKYQRFLDSYLQKSYEEWVDNWLLSLIQANWDQIDFKTFIDYLLKNKQENFGNDDVYQLAELRNQVINLREELEDLWPRDFQIIWWKMWSYEFRWSENFKYLGRNFYEVNIDFSKIKNHEVNSWLNIRTTYNRGDKFYIHYDWNNVIKYYSWNSFENRRLLWQQVISHKNETVVRWNTIYNRWAEQNIYLRDLWMQLRIKFFQKRER